MGFAQAIALGERDAQTYAPRFSAIDQPRMYSGNTLSRQPFASSPSGPLTSGNLNPAEIHRQAAEIALTEKALENERTRAEIELINEQTSAIRRKRENEPTDTYHQRSKDIESGYQERLKSIGAEEAMQQGREDQAQADDFRSAMMGVHLRDANAVKNFINKYGDPQTNVADVIFGPENDPGVIVAYEDGKKSYFKDAEQFYRGFMFWMDPKAEKIIGERTKREKEEGKEEEKKVMDRAKIWNDLDKTYDSRFEDPAGNTKPDAPDRDTWKAQEFERITGRKWERPVRGDGAIKKPEKAAEASPEAEHGKGKPPVAGAVWSEPRQAWFVKDKKGKWNRIVGDNEVRLGRRKEGEEAFDYGSGKGSPEGDYPSAAGAPIARGKVPPKPEERSRGKQGKGKVTGKVSFTDPETGKKVTRTYYADGTHEEKEG